MKRQLLYLLGGILVGSLGSTFFGSVATPPGKELPTLPTPYYTTLFENDDVRIVEHRLEPGESEPMHEHPPMSVYFLEGGVVRISVPDGSSFEESLTKEMTMDVDKLGHAIENLGSTTLHSILVEFKAD